MYVETKVEVNIICMLKSKCSLTLFFSVGAKDSLFGRMRFFHKHLRSNGRTELSGDGSNGASSYICVELDSGAFLCQRYKLVEMIYIIAFDDAKGVHLVYMQYISISASKTQSIDVSISFVCISFPLTFCPSNIFLVRRQFLSPSAYLVKLNL